MLYYERILTVADEAVLGVATDTLETLSKSASILFDSSALLRLAAVSFDPFDIDLLSKWKTYSGFILETVEPGFEALMTRAASSGGIPCFSNTSCKFILSTRCFSSRMTRLIHCRSV